MKTDYTRPATWRPYSPKLCTDCSADCCRMPVEVAYSEFIAMELTSEFEDEREAIKRLKKENIIRLYDNKRKVATLTQLSDGRCFFQGKEGKCTIYNKRPQTCRNFPKIGPRPSFCPYHSTQKN